MFDLSSWNLFAENVRIQELIAEFALRIVLLAQLNKVRQFPTNRFQFAGGVANSFPQCGRASNGANSFSIAGNSLPTAGQSCFQVK